METNQQKSNTVQRKTVYTIETYDGRCLAYIIIFPGGRNKI